MTPISKQQIKALLDQESLIESFGEPKQVKIPINIVEAYRCPGCKKVYINKLSAVKHAYKCVKNPFNKTCLTCSNRIILDATVDREDRCHCAYESGEELINDTKYIETSYDPEEDNTYYTGHDIVWECEHHQYGTPWRINCKTYREALSIIENYRSKAK